MSKNTAGGSINPGRIDTIQKMAVLRLKWIPKKMLVIQGDLLSFDPNNDLISGVNMKIRKS